MVVSPLQCREFLSKSLLQAEPWSLQAVHIFSASPPCLCFFLLRCQAKCGGVRRNYTQWSWSLVPSSLGSLPSFSEFSIFLSCLRREGQWNKTFLRVSGSSVYLFSPFLPPLFCFGSTPLMFSKLYVVVEIQTGIGRIQGKCPTLLLISGPSYPLLFFYSFPSMEELKCFEVRNLLLGYLVSSLLSYVV